MAGNFDAVSSGTAAGGGLTFSHTIGSGSNRLLVVGCSVDGSSQTITGVTYNAVAMTAGPSITGSQNTYIFYMLEANLPAAGAYNVVVTASGSIEKCGGAISYIDMAQIAPNATATANNTSTDAISVNITPTNPGSVIISCVSSGDPTTFTASGSQTERYDQAGGASSAQSGSTLTLGTPGVQSIGHTAAGSVSRLALVVAAFSPSTGSGAVVF